MSKDWGHGNMASFFLSHSVQIEFREDNRVYYGNIQNHFRKDLIYMFMIGLIVVFFGLILMVMAKDK